MDKNTRINEFKFWCQKVLPLVYDDSLSYYEVLCKIKGTLNSLITNVNNIPDYIIDLIKEYLDSDEIEKILSDLLTNFMVNVKYPPTGIPPAVGDGTADDTQSIQGCIDYAYNHGGLAVYIPAGKYLTGSLILKSDVTLFGMDRYSSILVLKGGAENPLIQAVEKNIGIYRLTLNGNSGIQVNQITVLKGNTDDALLSELQIINGHELMEWELTDSEGFMQMSDIIFNNAVYRGAHLYGAGTCQLSNVLFDNINTANSISVLDFDCSNSIIDLVSLSRNNVGLRITGYNNMITAKVASTIPFENDGTNNSIVIPNVSSNVFYSNDYFLDVHGNSTDSTTGNKNVTVLQNLINTFNGNVTETVGGNKKEIIKGTSERTVNGVENEIHNSDYEEYVNGKKTVTVIGDFTEGANSIESTAVTKYTLQGEDVELKPRNPLTYERFKPDMVKLKDTNGEYIIMSYDPDSPDYLSKVTTDPMDFDIEFLLEYVFDTFTEARKSAQGSAFDGTNFYLVVNTSDNNNTLYKFKPDLNSVTSKNLELGHANGMCYINSLSSLAIAPSDDKGIILINPSSLSITGYVLKGNTYTAIGYDEISDTIAVRYGSQVTIYDTGWNQINTFMMSEPITIRDDVGDGSTNSTARQDIAFYNNIVYNLYFKPNSIVAYDVKTGNPVKAYNIKTSYNSMYVGEPESINFYDGICYLSTNTYDNAGNRLRSRFFTFSPFKNAVINGNPGLDNSASPFTTQLVYVDDMAININRPTGTLKNPFRNIQDAFIACEKSPIAGKYNIIVKNTSMRDGIYLQGLTKNYEIKIDEGANIPGYTAFININQCSGTLLFNNLLIGDINTPLSTTTNSVLITNSNYVDFRKCTFTQNNNFNSTVEIRRTRVVFSDCIWKGTTKANHIFANNMAIVQLLTPTYETDGKLLSTYNAQIYVGGKIRTDRVVNDSGFVYPSLFDSKLSNKTILKGLSYDINTVNIGGTAINSKNNMAYIGIDYKDRIWHIQACIINSSTVGFSLFSFDDLQLITGKFSFDFTNSKLTLESCVTTDFKTSPPTTTNVSTINLRYLYFGLV